MRKIAGPGASDNEVTPVDIVALQEELSQQVDGEVRFDGGSVGAYSTDSSNYRQVPLGVVIPRNVDAGATAVEVCARFGAPVLSRGGGTSLGGQCTNAAVVIDWTKYCNRLISVDTEQKTCVVEPGIVLDELNRLLGPHELEFGPRPSTHSHCSLGGMIGNNSCGATAQAYGKTVDNVRRLEILTYDGARFWVGRTSDEELEEIIEDGGRRAEIHRGLRELIDRHAESVRDHFPDIPRRVSGYNLDSLLPEQGFDLAKALVGSEGTLVTVLRAELELVPVPRHEAMVVLGYEDICAAADDVPRILEHSDPLLLEALDSRMAELMFEEQAYLEPLSRFPEGESWLFVQFSGQEQEAVEGQVHDLLGALGLDEQDRSVTFSDDPSQEQKILKAREAGLGVTARPPGGQDTWPGWEDSAVPPDRLGDYLRDLKELFTEFGYDHPSIYGHFGHGCVHTRIPFRIQDGGGVADFRAFLFRAAELVASYGGSLSGEHGDGQARGELLPLMFGDRIVGVFAEMKELFDPENKMNPGKVTLPAPMVDDLRIGSQWRPHDPETHFAYEEDNHSFRRAVLRCVGAGNCRSHTGGVMCPSYRATGEEEHSTRGRARLLFEMLNGHEDSAIDDGWRSKEVHDALDLCLACKGCKSDCPVGVDMATYKAEFLSHHYQGRLRPAAHYSLGWLPVWARLARLAPRAVNAGLHTPGLSRLGKKMAGVTAQRRAPKFARESFVEWWRARELPEPDPSDPRAVVLWPDTFSNNFHPDIAKAAVRVLEDAGFRVAVPTETVCCGLTWISTGQLKTAQRVLGRTLEVLRPWITAGTPVVGLEPSCTAVFRTDLTELLDRDQDAARLARQVHTFSELLLKAEDWQPPRLDRQATVQTHCHQHAITKFDADRELMRRAGIDAHVLDEGCCGLAGNFGFEREHYDLSMSVGEYGVLPAVRDADPDALILADGFSCRTQIEHGTTGRHPVHLAEILADALPEPAEPERHRESDKGPRPLPEGALLFTTLTLAAVAATTLGAWIRARRAR